MKISGLTLKVTLQWKTTGVAGQEGAAETAEVEDILVKSRGCVVEMRGDESK